MRPIDVRIVRSARGGRWAVGVAAVIVVVVTIGLVPWLLGNRASSPPVNRPATTITPTTTDPETVTATKESSTSTSFSTSTPIGVFEWEFIDASTGAIPKVTWPGTMAHTRTGYHVWVSCEEFRGPNDPVGPSMIWSSFDGTAWTRQDISCDDHAFGTADQIVLDSFTQQRAFISDDAVEWTLLTEYGPSGTPSGGPPHGSENGYSPISLIWEVDDIDVLSDFTMPWDIGFYAPTGWLFEFEDGLFAISNCCQNPQNALSKPLVKTSSDHHTWIDVPIPSFIEAGYFGADDLWSIFAHDDRVAVASVSNGTDTQLWRTSNGVDWTDVTPPTVQGGGIWATDDFWVQGLGFFGDDSDGTLMNVSLDGNTWHPVEVPPAIGTFDGVVRVAGNKIIVFGDEQLLVGTYASSE